MTWLEDWELRNWGEVGLGEFRDWLRDTIGAFSGDFDHARTHALWKCRCGCRVVLMLQWWFETWRMLAVHEVTHHDDWSPSERNIINRKIDIVK